MFLYACSHCFSTVSAQRQRSSCKLGGDTGLTCLSADFEFDPWHLQQLSQSPCSEHRAHAGLSHKNLPLQVFHSLLKAHAMEARAIVRQAMAILTPAVPARMEDGHQMLTHWTRKIIVEEGHTVPQLVHILHLIVQHFKVCVPLGCCLFLSSIWNFGLRVQW